MQTIFEDFSFLLHINVPEKIPITHRFVERLLKIRSHQQKLLNHQDLEQQVFQAVLKMVKAEESFLIAKLEYENKEARFVKLTDYNETRLDILFSKVDLMFKDIDETALLEAIAIKSFDKLISSVRKSINLMKIATDVCYERMDLITKEWVNISEELLIKLKNFEQRGLKKVSNNLRLKLIPEIRELKALLREKPVKGAGSREEIQQKVLNMVEQAKSDIFGDLTESQIDLYNDLSHTMHSIGLIDLLSNAETLKDLKELILTHKIEIRVEKLVDQLI